MTIDIERRVRTLEEEANGERRVTRYALEQVGRNSEVLHGLGAELAAVRADLRTATARIDVLGGQMMAAESALTRHGRALDVLMQDVRQIRADQQQIRTDQLAMRAEQQVMRAEQQVMRTEQQVMRTEQQAMRTELNQKLDALIAGRPSDSAPV